MLTYVVIAAAVVLLWPAKKKEPSPVVVKDLVPERGQCVHQSLASVASVADCLRADGNLGEAQRAALRVVITALVSRLVAGVDE